MFRRRVWRALLLAGLTWIMGAGIAAAQLFSVPSQGDKFGGGLPSLSALQTARMGSTIFKFNTPGVSSLESPDNSVSKLDLKAPGNARKEYGKGYVQLLRKDLQGAIDHLTRAVSIYPSFVAAHNALGIAYLNLGQIQQAREEFARAVALDDLLPASYLNLGCAQLELQQYPEAVESLKKASSIAPLDLLLLTGLTYAELKNHDYVGVIATVRYVHGHKHQHTALVHLFAAGAWEAQQHLDEAQNELQILLNEDPKSPFAGQFRQVLLQIQAQQVSLAQAKRHPADPSPSASIAPPPASAEGVSLQIRQASQDMTEHRQITEVKAESDANCVGCPTSASADPVGASGPGSGSEQPDEYVARQVIRVEVQEVSMMFAATDHGNSVTNLTLSGIEIREDNQPPAAILGFYNVTRLQLVCASYAGLHTRPNAYHSRNRTTCARRRNRSVERGCLRRGQAGHSSRIATRCPGSRCDQRWRRQFEQCFTSTSHLGGPAGPGRDLYREHQGRLRRRIQPIAWKSRVENVVRTDRRRPLYTWLARRPHSKSGRTSASPPWPLFGPLQ